MGVMVVWQGWGIIGVLYAVAAFFVSMFFEFEVFPGSQFSIWFGITLLLAAVATWFTGVSMNRRRPQRKINLWVQERRAQLDRQIASGKFLSASGQPPASAEEAQRRSDAVLAAETTRLNEASLNRHTLFLAPMQYFAFLWVAIALWSIGNAFFGAPN